MTTTQIDRKAGTLTVSLASLEAETLGEILRLHVYGEGRGYRDFTVPGFYHPVPQSQLPTSLVDAMLGDPATREDFMEVTAYKSAGLTVAIASDGDTTLAFMLELDDSTRTVINHDAKKDYGWEDLTA